MGLQKPIESKLTADQKDVLAKLSAIRNFQLDPISSKFASLLNFNPPASEQISMFDYLKKIVESTLGAASMDLFLKTFLDKLFDPTSDKLERMVLKSVAKHLDSNGKKISQSQTNQEWLLQNALIPLHTAFVIAKAEIVKKIITMVFGPADKMSSDPVQQSILLNAAVCSSDMFSLSTPISNSDGDFEYNKVELKKRLTNGEVMFVISCQDVKIKLPQTIITQADGVITSNANNPTHPQNPSIMFENINNVVYAEAQRINAPENANSVRKSFSQIMVEKVINLIPITLEPYLAGVISTINNTSGTDIGLTPSDFTPSPCDVRTSCTGNDAAFQQKTAFISHMMNSVYAYLISVILQRVIKEIKKIIKNYILKKSQDAIKRKLAKRSFIADIELQKLEKAKKFAEAMTQLSGIFKFGDA